MLLPRKPSGVKIEHITISAGNRRIPCIVMRPERQTEKLPGVLWLHGGGYFAGMKEMVYMSRAVSLVKDYDAVVLCPGYRLAFYKPYPAAVEDCYQTLLYLKEQAQALNIRDNQIFVGGESAGGGLTAAVCMMARDKRTVNIAYQMPLYPMLDCLDTDSSRNNHGKVWNTWKNHLGWRIYLRGMDRQQASPYASPARQTDYTHLPPAYTFVGDGEPFYDETKTYIENLQKCGILAELDVYHSDMHAFDMMKPELEISRLAAKRFNEHFAYAVEHYFAEQG